MGIVLTLFVMPLISNALEYSATNQALKSSVGVEFLRSLM